jgi:Sulfotransferase family
VKRVLVVGVPRSGTSWVGEVLASTPGATYLSEPDNHGYRPFALRAKLRLPGRFYPAPRPDDEPPDYLRLWRAALGFERRGVGERPRTHAAMRLLRTSSAGDPHRLLAKRELPIAVRLAVALAVPERPAGPGDVLVVKSVHAPLALEWIAARFPVEVLVVLRRPLSVLSSWLELGWVGDAPASELDPRVAADISAALGAPPLDASFSRLAEAAWLIGILSTSLLTAAARNPGWHTVSHEGLCESPHEQFAGTAAGLGLHWGEASNAVLDRLDRPGRGYETTRVAATVPDAWRSRLSPAQADEATAVLDTFPVDDWLAPPVASRL